MEKPKKDDAARKVLATLQEAMRLFRPPKVKEKIKVAKRDTKGRKK